MNFTNILNRKTTPLFRRLIQISFAVFCSYVGLQFYQFFRWIIGQTSIYVPRPPSIEAFLPIGALVSLKHLFLTGQYDTIHPAGLTIFLTILLSALILRKSFCGWICPVGFASNLAEKTGAKLKTLFKLPVFIDLPLLSLKYIVLIFFIYAILIKMGQSSIEQFINSPYNRVVDAKMLLLFIEPTTLTIIVFSILIIISFFLKNFWCRYLCPYGALLGVIAIISPIQIFRDPTKCINCKQCETNCPSSIMLTNNAYIWSPECNACLECVAICPVDNCISLQFVHKKTIKPIIIPILVVSLFLSTWLLAISTNHWQTKTPISIQKNHYIQNLKIVHP